MSIPESLRLLVGEWVGTSELWLPPDPVRGSEATAAVALVARGKFASVSYTWAFDGEPQEGLLLLGHQPEQAALEAVWVDSWHMGDALMRCQGGLSETGAIEVRGSYAAAPGPDWGWRTVIAPSDGESFVIVMYNISPEGQEDLAFKISCARQM